jgi:hypothetical protein
MVETQDRTLELEKTDKPWWESEKYCLDVEKAKQEAPSMTTADRLLRFGKTNIQEQFVFYTWIPELGEVGFSREFECA